MAEFLRTISVNNAAKEVGKGKEKPTHISLFTGIGGFDLGFRRAGIENRVMVEWNKSCCLTLRANWFWSELQKRTNLDGSPQWKTKEEMKKILKHYQDREPVILERDITKLPTEEILKAGGLQVGEAMVVSGGPPCQGFSNAGKRMIDDPRNVLYKEFVRVVREALPVCFIMENVPGMATLKNGKIMLQVCEDFANCGYDVVWDILDAADYGVPQHRRRVFIVGKRIDLLIFTAEMERPQLHMGAVSGEINHPDKFRKKHGMIEKDQLTLGDCKEPKNFIELLQKLNKAKGATA